MTRHDCKPGVTSLLISVSRQNQSSVENKKYGEKINICQQDLLEDKNVKKLACSLSEVQLLLVIVIILGSLSIARIIILITLIILPLYRVFTIMYLSHVSSVYYIRASLWLQFVVHVMSFPMINVLFFYVRTFRGICAVTNIAVFCSSLMSCLPGMLFRYFLNDFEVVLRICTCYYWYYFRFCTLHMLYFYCKVFIF